MGWSNKIETVERPTFSCLPGTHNFFTTEDRSPIQVFIIFFNNEIFRIIQDERSLYAKCITS